MWFSCALLLNSIVSAASFNPPDGPFNVGMTQYIFNHTTPNDPVTPKNASSILLATIFYPTLSVPNPSDTVPYLDAINADLWNSDLNLPAGSLESLRPWNQWQAPMLNKTEFGTSQLPTVFLSPGASGNALFYNVLSSGLASEGYTVIALDHPGETPYLQVPYGHGGIYGIGFTASWNNTFLKTVYKYRVSDALATIRHLYPAWVESINAPFNTTHYLTLGHSLGGSVAAGVAAAESSVLGGINLDGEFWDLPDVKKPFLMVAGSEHTPEIDPTWAPFSMNQSGWWEWMTVTGTGHWNYFDIGDWIDLLGLRNHTNLPLLGSIWAPRTDNIVKSFTFGFFDVVLGKRTDVLILPNPRFPEVKYINGSSKAR